MGSLKVLLFQYARDIWRRRWFAIGVAWAICVVGWFVVSRMPDVYESSARVYMSSDEALTPLLHGIAVTDFEVVYTGDPITLTYDCDSNGNHITPADFIFIDGYDF